MMLNIAIIYILTHEQFSIHKNTTFEGTLLGYGVYYKNRRRFYLPIRPERKTELNEEVHMMINESQQSKRQRLRAIFSWLKTISEVEQFREDYEVVDKKFVPFPQKEPKAPAKNSQRNTSGVICA